MEAYKAQDGITLLQLATSLAMYWQTATSLPIACGVGTATCTRNDQEKEKNTSVLACCNCKLAEEENPNPSIYRDYSHTKDKICQRRSQKAPKTSTGIYL
jgi:hypothetical protein